MGGKGLQAAPSAWAKAKMWESRGHTGEAAVSSAWLEGRVLEEMERNEVGESEARP